MGLFIHKIKDYETADYQKDWQTCNSDIPDYRNMSANKNKGIVPTGMIMLLLLTGGFIGFLFRILVMILKIFIFLFIIGLLIA